MMPAWNRMAGEDPAVARALLLDKYRGEAPDWVPESDAAIIAQTRLDYEAVDDSALRAAVQQGGGDSFRMSQAEGNRVADYQAAYEVAVAERMQALRAAFPGASPDEILRLAIQ